MLIPTHTHTHTQYPDLDDITFLTLQNVGKVYYRLLHWDCSFGLLCSALIESVLTLRGSLLLPISWDTLFQTFISKLPMNKPVQGQRCVFCVWNNEVLEMKCWNKCYFFVPCQARDLFSPTGYKKWPTHTSSCTLLLGSNPAIVLSILSVHDPSTHHTRTHTHTHTHIPTQRQKGMFHS